jgi:hypothetical protein
MFTAESLVLLIKPPRRRTGQAQRQLVCPDDGDGGKVSDPIDPDDVIDPDDLIVRAPVHCAFLLPPLARSEAWWIALVFGHLQTVVSLQDALVALAHVAYHLGYARANTGSPVTEPVKVEQLHETVEALYGAPGWTALVECWQEEAGIAPEPAKKEKRQQKPDRTPIPAAEPPGKAATPPLPANAPLLEEGLHRALPAMPPQVAAFLLHVPRDPSPWRYCESLDERSQREQLENEGCWTG